VLKLGLASEPKSVLASSLPPNIGTLCMRYLSLLCMYPLHKYTSCRKTVSRGIAVRMAAPIGKRLHSLQQFAMGLTTLLTLACSPLYLAQARKTMPL
jgi:hypothetical protein